MTPSGGNDLILAIDQSTSATKAVVFGRTEGIVVQASFEHAQRYPKPGWVEHDPEELYANAIRAVGRVYGLLGAAKSRVAALSITNQRETIVVWDRATGRPVYNAVVWQCRRGAELCARLKTEGMEEETKAATGLPIDPYYSASKIRWVLDNVAGARSSAERGELAFGTIDSWLVWRLTRGRVHVTDPTNASRTMLMNLAALSWDERMFGLFGIPIGMAPRIERSDRVVGATDAEGTFDRQLPIAGLLGDSHAAFFAQRCFEPGLAKATYGTGTSVMMDVGARPVPARLSVVASVGWAIERRVDFVLEGNIHSTGDTIRWLRDGLGVIGSAAESEGLARTLATNEGVYLVPAFSGLGAPYWDGEARAAIVGMSRGTTRAHLARAALEAIAYQVRDLVEAMEENARTRLTELRADGGATRNALLMQFQADLLDVPVRSSAIAEASAFGSAMMAGLAVGAWSRLSELPKLEEGSRLYESTMDEGTRASLIDGWHAAVARTLSNPRRSAGSG